MQIEKSKIKPQSKSQEFKRDLAAIAGLSFIHNMKMLFSSADAIYSIASTETVVVKSISIQCFTLKYIEAATQMYKTMIGEGGFGSVYRGTLPDGQEVAVKVRSATSTQGTREFDNEVSFNHVLSAIRHDNLVPLIGYCCENDHQILVYPFMSNGSLQDRLYGKLRSYENSLKLDSVRILFIFLHSLINRRRSKAQNP